MKSGSKGKIKSRTVDSIHRTVKDEFGEDLWEEVLERTCEELGIKEEELNESDWQPLEFPMTFIRILHERNGERDRDYSLTFKVGREDAKKAFSTTFRFLAKMFSIENLLDRASTVWSQYFTRGILSIDKKENQYIATLKELKLEHPYDYYLCGYFVQAAMVLGADIKKARHAYLVWDGDDTSLRDEKLTSCIAEGDEESVFILES